MDVKLMVRVCPYLGMSVVRPLMKHLRFEFSLLIILAIAVPNAICGDDPKKDPDEIGNRNVSGKVNFYSLEKEIALGKGLAQQVERQAKIINDPVIAEYVNRVGQKPATAVDKRHIHAAGMPAARINVANADA